MRFAEGKYSVDHCHCFEIVTEWAHDVLVPGTLGVYVDSETNLGYGERANCFLQLHA